MVIYSVDEKEKEGEIPLHHALPCRASSGQTVPRGAAHSRISPRLAVPYHVMKHGNCNTIARSCQI
jgi:hypothetical protein